jgi:hypothetical protein
MLARPGPIPTGRGWLFEPKPDGFSASLAPMGAASIAIEEWLEHGWPNGGTRR